MTTRLTSLFLLMPLAALLTSCTYWSHREFQTVATQEEVFTARADDPYSDWVTAAAWPALRNNLTAAERAYDESPNDEMAIIWLGRRQAYLGFYHEAIATFSDGLTSHPNSFKLRRHRGHRFITVRQFDRAVDDLSRAARLAADHPDETEPDGAPNALGIPRSTTQTNIYYHLALAHYLLGDFEQARDAWQVCLDLSQNDDMRIATMYWLYLTNRRLGENGAAAEIVASVYESMDIIENFDYHELLLMFKGVVEPEDVLDFDSGTGVQQATRAYGVAMYDYFAGKKKEANKLLAQIVAEANPAAFGAIAAEVDFIRLD